MARSLNPRAAGCTPLPGMLYAMLEAADTSLAAALHEDARHKIHVHVEQGGGEGAPLADPGVNGDRV
eukprot:CAMPEP_0202871876 /NCGR_PEP_ID=MMETSP1391-20130828/19911_1 /ASSEMBLY_ACC=CAM_ASM_000867 /TAXON_ID=1034604 /ORGANISM="Chlamydomonas leiostraca, Strain SAG 11-49" /LENGTH=66 /DNA_ID=CAMNT_0049552797 /DNA_START=196 /DNA_END=395 /DNA_ORIENTATION=-